MRTEILDMMYYPLRHVGAGNMDRGQDGQDRARLPQTGRKLSKLPAFIKTFKTEEKNKQSSVYNTYVSYENIPDEKVPSIMLSSNESVDLMRDQLIDKEVCFTLEISPSNCLSFR